MEELNDIEIIDLRKKLYQTIHNLPHHQHQPYWATCTPESKDFDLIRDNFISLITETLYGKGIRDNIWIEAERTWNFIRYGWL